MGEHSFASLAEFLVYFDLGESQSDSHGSIHWRYYPIEKINQETLLVFSVRILYEITRAYIENIHSRSKEEPSSRLFIIYFYWKFQQRENFFMNSVLDMTLDDSTNDICDRVEIG